MATSKLTTITKSQKDLTAKSSVLSRYQNSMVGSKSLFYLVYYELCVMLSVVPGATGIFLRKVFWPKIFHSCGKGVLFGANIVLRYPNKISIGNRVVISEGCILDARSPSESVAIELKDDGILSTYVRIACKNGRVNVGERCGIGASTVIHAFKDNHVSIGKDAAIGPQCYISGGGSYNLDRTDIPIAGQGMKVTGGSILADGVWLGAKTSVLGGVNIGKGAVAGTGSVVTKNIPEMSIAVGVPARVIKKRK